MRMPYDKTSNLEWSSYLHYGLHIEYVFGIIQWFDLLSFNIPEIVWLNKNWQDRKKTIDQVRYFSSLNDYGIVLIIRSKLWKILCNTKLVWHKFCQCPLRSTTAACMIYTCIGINWFLQFSLEGHVMQGLTQIRLTIRYNTLPLFVCFKRLNITEVRRQPIWKRPRKKPDMLHVLYCILHLCVINLQTTHDRHWTSLTKIIKSTKQLI